MSLRDDVIEVIGKLTRDNTDKSVDTFDCLTEYNFDENSCREFKKLLTGCQIDIMGEVRCHNADRTVGVSCPLHNNRCHLAVLS